MLSKSDGRFQVTAIDEGSYRLTAQDADHRSEDITVTLAADDPADVKLVLKSRVAARGRVAAGDAPIVMADVYGIPRDTHFAPFMPHTKTNETGRFELKLPPRTTVFDLVVVHPAFDIVLTRVNGQIDRVRNVVTTQSGGILTVHGSESKELVLRHAGGECWLHWLASVPGAMGVVEAARIVLPRLEPGEYTVCSAKTNQCAHGYLPPYGTLTLAIEDAKSPNG